MYRFRWRLEYSDGRAVDESPTGTSIRLADRGALHLFVMDGDRAVHGVQLRDDSGPWQPVWYRLKSLDQGSREEPRTDALVLGRGRFRDAGLEYGVYRFNAQLGDVEPVRDGELDLTAIAMLAAVSDA